MRPMAPIGLNAVLFSLFCCAVIVPCFDHPALCYSDQGSRCLTPCMTGKLFFEMTIDNTNVDRDSTIAPDDSLPTS